MGEHQQHSMPDQHYIEATTSLVEKPLRTLKDDELFGVFDTQGDVNARQAGPEGLYFKDTRFQSHLVLRIGQRQPLLLGSTVLEDNGALVSDMTNADLHDETDDDLWLPRDSVFVSRLKILNGNACFDRILIRRYEPIDRPLEVSLDFDSDFADLFEVRGEKRKRRGQLHARCLDERSVQFVYEGLDGTERKTTIWFDRVPDRLTTRSATWQLDLSTTARCSLVAKMTCSLASEAISEPSGHLGAFRAQRKEKRGRKRAIGQIASSNELVNEVFNRSGSDISMLLTNTAYGAYPYAGVPWYSTVFGRDGIITAMQMLWIAPEVACGVLKVLAATQAVAIDEEADAEPGKIIHEMRSGEMAELGEVPFRRYYGTIDATPLFVWLAGDYFRRSGDLVTIRGIWPNILAALAWIDQYGDRDGDCFVEYERQTDHGLVNQGWKDSHDSIFHADGSGAEGPIALCEVQGYAYAAKRAGAELAQALGHAGQAAEFRRSAERLRAAFEDQFWLEDLGTYALALDGRKRPCRVRASNAGHVLAAGIVRADRAERVAALLTEDRFFSGWGIRTLATGEARYNPMSYHNGSVWPHDNALIALGFSRYGFNTLAAKILQGLMDAATQLEFQRLPELFCGFKRGRERAPIPYPVACAPQAWAAAAPYALLQASIGLELDHCDGNLRLNNPALPSGIENLVLPELQIGDSRMRLRLSRSEDDVVTTVLDRHGPAGLVVKR